MITCFFVSKLNQRVLNTSLLACVHTCCDDIKNKTHSHTHTHTHTHTHRSTHEGLGDVIARLAPFLKLYATYTAGFEDAMKTLTEWTKRDRKFDTLIREFEVTNSFTYTHAHIPQLILTSLKKQSGSI